MISLTILLYLILFLSGFAGLGYEMVWTRMLALGLGHEVIAVLSVVSAFFCGLALGSWALERVRVFRQGPGITYAILEAAIGLWSLALIVLIPSCNQLMAQAMGPEPSVLLHWTISFLSPFFLFLPATFAMGGTLPIMRHFLAFLGKTGKTVGTLYAVNTFGAVAGTFLSVFFIIPWLGSGATLLSFALTNLACSFLSILIATTRLKKWVRPHLGQQGNETIPALRLSFLLLATGFLGIGYEVLVIRMLSQVLEDTVYSFANALMVYLFGTACGAALYQRFLVKRRSDEVVNFLLVSLSFLCLMGIVVLWGSNEIYGFLRQGFGVGQAGAILGEITLAAMVFLFPTLAMGALFSHLAQESAERKIGLGGGLCINTLGGSFSPFIFGVVLLPLWGAKIAFIIVSLGYLFLILLGRSWRFKPALVPIAIALPLVFITGPLRTVTLEPGDQILDYREGIMAAVTVVRDIKTEVHLKVNNRFQMGGTSSIYSDRRQGHIPLLLHPNPKNALFLGMGTGATLAACIDHPGLQAEGVELVPEVISVLDDFQKSIGDLNRHPRIKIVSADARRYVNASRKSYDVIVADLFHPARDGAGSLYTLEHFKAMRTRLAKGGVFCQWLPLYQMDLETLRIITRTFLEAFPEGSAYLAHYSVRAPIIGLISTVEGKTYPAKWLETRVRDAELARKLWGLRLDTDFNLFGCFLAGSADLKRFAGSGPLNTDNRPLVTYQTPGFAYSSPEPAYRRLLALLDLFHPVPEQVLVPPQTAEEEQEHRRLAAYWMARNQFIKAGVGVKETDDVVQLLAQVRKPLIAVIRLSPDFDAAYEPLLAMAQRLAPIDPRAAAELTADLVKAYPHHSEARATRGIGFAREKENP
jgi:spermidine synthase